MTLAPPISKAEDTTHWYQETIDLYTNPHCKIVILQSKQVGKRICSIKKKYGDMTRLQLKHYSHIALLLEMKKIGRRRGYRYNTYPGLPCHKCSNMVTVGSKCVIKKSGGGANTNTYHYDCARSVNVI